ncbi:MAG: hypothetical protein PF690_11210 [Deltaproteobacteria bacterium]|jgi:DNA polymerase III delta subunit|nr:hypothetical protein [Deltaproteobacteria bacterium]
MDDVKLFKQFGEKQILEIIKQALINGKEHGLDKSFNINDVRIKDNALLVYYNSEISNRFAIYNDFALIIGFIHSKSEVAKKIAEYWVNTEIPSEFKEIMTKMLNISNN